LHGSAHGGHAGILGSGIGGLWSWSFNFRLGNTIDLNRVLVFTAGKEHAPNKKAAMEAATQKRLRKFHRELAM
jgi:hypothetical protein